MQQAVRVSVIRPSLSLVTASISPVTRTVVWSRRSEPVLYARKGWEKVMETYIGIDVSKAILDVVAINREEIKHFSKNPKGRVPRAEPVGE